MPRLITIATLACAAACGQAPTARHAPAAAPTGLHFEIEAIDRRADPCTDFYDYACGGWRATHPIPPDRNRWDRYAELEAENLARERAIVERAATDSPAQPRVAAYYRACMDERTIDARALAPIRELLARIDAIRTARDAGPVITELHAHGIAALFQVYADADPHDAHQTVLWLDTGELGLPRPAAYADDAPAARALRTEYAAHLVRLAALVGASPVDDQGSPAAGGAAERRGGSIDARVQADATVAFETALARAALPAAEARHIDVQDHPMTIAELAARYPALDWPAYVAALGVHPGDHVIVAQPAWLDAVNAALAAPGSLAGLRAYLRMLVVRDTANLLPTAIADEKFAFDGRVVRGAQVAAPRWQRCLALVDRDIGDDVGALFVARYFPAATRARINAMIDALRAAFRADIATSDWLGPSARAAATAKLGTVLAVIGASNRPRTFDGLRITADDAFGNAWRARAFDIARDLATVGAPTDRERFFDALPQEAEGFGSKALNAIGFSAGFLQPPIFDPAMDDAVNFGGLGSVIGHELTHRFDDDGAKLDKDGNLNAWWQPDDVARFQTRAQCFADEYARFHTDDGTPLDGKLTLGENIADNGGIRLSYAALQPSERGPTRDGFTPAQRFFLAWGQIRCENVTPEAARLQAQNDPHAAGRWRVNGVVANMPEFARAFACPASAPMAPATRCKLW